jgi:hypothetical protein
MGQCQLMLGNNEKYNLKILYLLDLIDIGAQKVQL